MSAGAGEVGWRWLGRVAYGDVRAEQLALRERVWAGAPGEVLLCEHPPVITLGRNGSPDHILAAGDIPVERIERGGQVTYHGPGQLMIYPVVRLRSVVAFLEAVARAIIDTAAAFGVAGAEWRREPAGVWLGAAKLAACGIHVSRGVAVHGFAFNVATPRDAWRVIRPCGLDVPLISLSEALTSSRDATRGGVNRAALPRERGREGPLSIEVERVARECGPRVVEAVRVRPTV